MLYPMSLSWAWACSPSAYLVGRGHGAAMTRSHQPQATTPQVSHVFLTSVSWIFSAIGPFLSLFEYLKALLWYLSNFQYVVASVVKTETGP